MTRAERHFGHEDHLRLPGRGRFVERRPDAQAPLDVHRREITLPQGIPVLRLDDDIAPRSPVARQQGIHPVLAVGQRFPPDVSLQHAALRLETLERKVGQFGRQNLGLSVVRTGDVEHGVIHKIMIM